MSILSQFSTPPGAAPGVLKVALDVAIFGGGVAGLWTLARLKQAGYSALLFESRTLGGVQSIASQGIIHGGTKYALTGKLTGSSEAIREMPGIWRGCLAGTGELDLSRVRVLSDHQYLWSDSGLGSAVTGFFASKMMQSRMIRVPRDAYPDLFNHPGFKGHLYRLEEPVLDTASLMSVLIDPILSHTIAYDPDQLIPVQDSPGQFHLAGVDFSAKRILFTGGAGNQGLLEKWGRSAPRMQRRPLNMVMLRGRLPELFGHCLATSPNPRLTVTSYPLGEGERVWYLGGQIAEEGVGRSDEDQIARARQLLQQTLPWLEIDGDWSTLPIDRAEPLMPKGRRPDDVFLDIRDGIYTAWPTKLAFAPRLAAVVIAALESEHIAPSGDEPELPAAFKHPDRAEQPWSQVKKWN